MLHRSLYRDLGLGPSIESPLISETTSLAMRRKGQQFKTKISKSDDEDPAKSVEIDLALARLRMKSSGVIA